MSKVGAKTRALLHKRANSMCEMCGQPANNAHHRKGAGQGGPATLSNLLLLCGSGTTGCHGYVTENPADSRRHGWMLWRSNEPAEVPVMYRGSWARLDDEGNVEILPKGVVRYELGHLRISGYGQDAGGEH